jgi:hypothetical protein
MGASVSTIQDSSTINNTNLDIDVSTFNQIQQSCKNIVDQKNEINITGSTINGLTTDQQNISNNLCILQTALDETKNTDIESQILNKISSDAQLKGGFPGMGTTSTSLAKVMTVLNSKLDASTRNIVVKDCILQQTQQNLINIKNSNVNGSQLSQVNNTIAKCISEHKNTSSFSTEIKEARDSTTDSTVQAQAGNPIQDIFSGLSNLISSLGSLIGLGPTTIIISFVVIIVLSLISSSISIFLGTSDSKPAQMGKENLTKIFQQMSNQNKLPPYTQFQ